MTIISESIARGICAAQGIVWFALGYKCRNTNLNTIISAYQGVVMGTSVGIGGFKIAERFMI